MRIIGLTGASGSGKSTIADDLQRICLRDGWPPRVTLMSIDRYYRDLSHLALPEREKVDFDHPSAIEFELVADHLAQLRQGFAVPCPRYDFATHSRAVGTDTISPTPIILLEGLLLGAWDQVSTQVDSLVFVDTPLEVCLARRLNRDSAERGRSAASIIEFWESRALPGFRRWSARARFAADLIVSGELSSGVAAEIVRREFQI